MARQGQHLQEWEIRRIVSLLASTDMTIHNIAQRTGRSHAAIAAVNRRFQVRNYGGRRSSWVLSPPSVASIVVSRTSEVAA
jgi:hypothetical protein